jgi:hypothetical protein
MSHLGGRVLQVVEFRNARQQLLTRHFEPILVRHGLLGDGRQLSTQPGQQQQPKHNSSRRIVCQQGSTMRRAA